MSSDYIDNDFDGLVDGADPDADGDQNVGFLDDDNDGEADEEHGADAEGKTEDVDLSHEVTNADRQKRRQNRLAADNVAG